MEFKYNLTEEDYIQFNLFHLKNSQSTRKALNIQRFVSPIIFILFAFLFSKIGDIPFLTSFIIFFIMSIIWILLYPKYFYSRITGQVKRMINEGKNDSLLGQHTLVFTEDGITDSTNKGESKVNWSGIIHFKENEKYLYLYNSSVSAFILPKREFGNIDQIKNTIQAKLI